MSGTGAVFLDRDGVLNEGVAVGARTRAPRSLEELHIIDGAGPAVARLRAAGYLTIIVTNQPDVARGDLDPAVASAIDDTVRLAVGATASFACWHDNADDCQCRKPRPGLLLDAASRYGVDLPSSWMVGDRWVDIAAGVGAGVRTVLIETTSSWSTTSAGAPGADLRPDVRVRDVAEAVEAILSTDMSTDLSTDLSTSDRTKHQETP